MRGARAWVVLVLLAVAGGALAGCVAPGAGQSTSTAPSASADAGPATPSASATTAPPQDAKPDDDPNAATDAVAAAVAAVTAYCRPGVNKGEWVAALSPLLTDAGVVAYNTVNPATVPCKAVTGDASVRDGDNAYVFRVNVPTDAGVYEAYVTRPATSAPWRVERMAPPE